VLSSCPAPNPDDFSPLITVLACNGSQACIAALLRAGCDPLKPYRLNLDDAARGANVTDPTAAAVAPKVASAAAARPSSSYREAVAIGAKKPKPVPELPQAAAAPASAAAVAGSALDRTRVACALDAAAYYGLLPAFELLLEACKRRLTLQHCKSCAAAAAAADQLPIIQHLHANVIGDADGMFWPEAAAIAAARDHCSLLQHLLSLSSRAWMLPLDCSVAPYVASAPHFFCCKTSCAGARAAASSTSQPPTSPTASSFLAALRRDPRNVLLLLLLLLMSSCLARGRSSFAP
jgi:hypothetical protein